MPPKNARKQGPGPRRELSFPEHRGRFPVNAKSALWFLTALGLPKGLLPDFLAHPEKEWGFSPHPGLAPMIGVLLDKFGAAWPERVRSVLAPMLNRDGSLGAELEYEADVLYQKRARMDEAGYDSWEKMDWAFSDALIGAARGVTRQTAHQMRLKYDCAYNREKAPDFELPRMVRSISDNLSIPEELASGLAAIRLMDVWEDLLPIVDRSRLGGDGPGSTALDFVMRNLNLNHIEAARLVLGILSDWRDLFYSELDRVLRLPEGASREAAKSLSSPNSEKKGWQFLSVFPDINSKDSYHGASEPLCEQAHIKNMDVKELVRLHYLRKTARKPKKD